MVAIGILRAGNLLGASGLTQKTAEINQSRSLLLNLLEPTHEACEVADDNVLAAVLTVFAKTLGDLVLTADEKHFLHDGEGNLVRDLP